LVRSEGPATAVNIAQVLHKWLTCSTCSTQLSDLLQSAGMTVETRIKSAEAFMLAGRNDSWGKPTPEAPAKLGQDIAEVTPIRARTNNIYLMSETLIAIKDTS